MENLIKNDVSKKVEEIYQLIKKTEDGGTPDKENKFLEKIVEGTTGGDLTRLDDAALKEMIKFAVDPCGFAKNCKPIKDEDDWPATNRDSAI